MQACVLGMALVVGGLLHLLHLPLAWVLGPLITTATASALGVPVFAPVAGRRAGQVVIGISIGLQVTGAVVVQMAIWSPVMLLTSLIAVVCSAILSVPFATLSRLDRKTAFFAMMPGGLSEMANLAATAGAQPEPIALAQALRVALLVCLMPPLILSLGIHGSAIEHLELPPLALAQVASTLAIGLLGVGAARVARLNNPWMIGALVAAAIASASGSVTGHLPVLLYWFAQYMIGIAIGARFRREVVLKLRRVFLASSLFVLLLAAMLFLYAATLSALTGLDLATAALAASPGGVAEMAITARALDLSVGLITGFHIVRAFLVNGFALPLWSLLHRLGLFRLLDRIGAWLS